MADPYNMAERKKGSKKKKAVDKKNPVDTQFKPGHQVNKGRVQYDREEIAAKKLDTATYFRILNIHFWSPVELLESVVNDPSTPMIEMIVCRAMLNARYKGDIHTLDYFVSRLIGKIPDKLVIDSKNPFAEMTLEEMKAKHAELVKSNRETLNHILKEKKLNDGSGKVGSGDST